MMNHLERTSTTIELGTKTGYYGPLAVSYDRRFGGALGRLKNWREERVVWRAVKDAGNIQRVLDVPCGTGRLLRGLVLHGIPHLVGADVSRDMIDLSRRHGTSKGRPAGHLEYVQCDARYLPFHNDSFDLVMSGRFLHHLFNLPQAVRIQVMREFARVSRRWVLGDFNMQYGLKYYLNKVRIVLKGKHFKSRRTTKTQVFTELTEAGLRVEQVYPVSWIASEKWYILCLK